MPRDDAAGGLRGLRATPSRELLEAVRVHYGLGEVKRVVDLGGSSSLNILVRDKDHRYVIRVYRPYVTAARLADLYSARRALNAGGVPSPDILLTREGQPWITFAGRLVEVDRYVDHEATMNSWERLEQALPTLGQIHTLLQEIEAGPAGKHPIFANHIEAQDVLTRTRRGTQRIRGWATSSTELQLADRAAELAQLVVAAERDLVPALPRQLVHGDFWDNNVLFRDGRVVLVTDFDFMGERTRIDDLGLTLYFTSLEYGEEPVSDGHLARLRRLIDAYDRGLTEPLSRVERAALPLVLARQPLWSIGGWVALLDEEQSARQHALESTWAVRWALGIMRQLERWQTAFS